MSGSTQDKVNQYGAMSMQKRALRVAAGIIVGLALAAIFAVAFSGNAFPSWVGNAVMSATTYMGIAFAIFGYFYKKNGQKTFASDFLLGFGIGLILIYWIEDGQDIVTTV